MSARDVRSYCATRPCFRIHAQLAIYAGQRVNELRTSCVQSASSCASCAVELRSNRASSQVSALSSCASCASCSLNPRLSCAAAPTYRWGRATGEQLTEQLAETGGRLC